MATDDGDALSASERRVAELMALLATEAVATRTDLRSVVIRRLRVQRDTRIALTVGSGVLAAVVAGVVGLFPPRVGGEEAPR
jgi:hypothetical protein